MPIVETDGEASFVNAAANPAYKVPPAAQSAAPDDGSQLLTTGMAGARHLERLTRLRALRAAAGKKDK